MKEVLYREKKIMLLGFFIESLGLLEPKIIPVVAPLSVFIYWVAMKDYAKKIGTKNAYGHFKTGATLYVVFLVVTLVGAVMVWAGFGGKAPEFTGAEHVALPGEALLGVTLVLVGLVFAIIGKIMILSSFEKVGSVFGIKEFSYAKKTYVILAIGLPLWAVIIREGGGLLIVSGIVLLYMMFLFFGIVKLPPVWDEGGLTPLDPLEAIGEL